MKDKHKRAEDPAAMGAGDSQLNMEPPNVDAVQPPGGTATPAGAAGGDGMGAPAPQTDPSAAGGPVAAAAAAGNAAGAFEQELEAARRELGNANDRHLRLAAEFDNYRKRMERDRADIWTRAQAELAGRLLDVLDDLERVAHHSESATAQTLHEGIQLIERKLRGALSAAGLEDVAAESASFDPQLMEAVAVVAAESAEDDDVVSDVFQRGYRFRGQLLRPARVRVKKHD